QSTSHIHSLYLHDALPISHRLGELVDETHFEFDIESRHWKQYKGVAFGNIYSSSANHREKFNRRKRENQKRWFKQLIPLIEQHRSEEHTSELQSRFDLVCR